MSRKKSRRAKGKQVRPKSVPTSVSASASTKDIDKLILQRDFNSAVRLLRVQVARHPTDEGRRRLAECLFETDSYGEGQSALEHISAKTATDIALIGWAHLRQEHWDDAIQKFEEALAREPHPATYYYLACSRSKDQPDYLLDQETRDVVKDLLAQAVVLPNCPEDAFLWLEGLQGHDPASILARQQILDTALDQHPDSTAVRLRLASLSLHRLQDPAAALRVLEPLLMQEAPLVRTLWYAFEAHSALGESEAALASIEAIPRDAHAEGVGMGKVKGDLLLALGRVDEAIEQYDAEVGSAHEDAAIVGLFSRAWARLTRNQVEAALEDVAAALDRHIADGNAYRFTGPITIQDELYSYSYGECVRQVCTTLLDAALDTPAFSPSLEGRLAFVLYKLDEFGEEDVTRLLLRAADRIPAEDLARDALDEDLISHYVNAGELAHAVELHLQLCLRRIAKDTNGALSDQFADFEPSDYDPTFDPASIRTKTDRTRIHKAALRQLKACRDDNSAQKVFIPFYHSFWRTLLFDGHLFKEVTEVVGLLRAAAAGATSELFDYAYALHELRSLPQAEAAYREYLEGEPESAAALHNLSIVVEERGRLEEAATLSSKAATAAPSNEKMTQRSKALQAKLEELRALARRREEFLQTAPERWPQLDKYKRQLLSTLTVITEFDNWAHLSRLSGIGERYLRGHWHKLIELGMVIEDTNGRWEVNNHITHLISQERSHAVVTTLIHAETTLAVKPIFNSLQEYTIYKLLITLFPNHLVFPNMALQSIFQYERMKELLDMDEFRYFLMAHVDVCVTSTANYLPIIAFEIDSSYHDQVEQAARDTKKNHIFQVGGVPLVRLRAWGQPTEEAVRQYLIESVRAFGDELTAGSIQVNPLVDVARELDLQRFAPNPVVSGEQGTTTP